MQASPERLDYRVDDDTFRLRVSYGVCGESGSFCLQCSVNSETADSKEATRFLTTSQVPSDGAMCGNGAGV